MWGADQRGICQTVAKQWPDVDCFKRMSVLLLSLSILIVLLLLLVVVVVEVVAYVSGIDFNSTPDAKKKYNPQANEYLGKREAAMQNKVLSSFAFHIFLSHRWHDEVGGASRTFATFIGVDF